MAVSLILTWYVIDNHSKSISDNRNSDKAKVSLLSTVVPLLRLDGLQHKDDIKLYSKSSSQKLSSSVDFCLTGHETDVWFMGQNGIDWSSDTPRVGSGFNTSGWASTYQEGYTSICDRNGKLLLYTNNVNIFNGSHQLITAIQGDTNSTMCMILPQPGNDSIYYIFHPQTSSDYQNDLSQKSLLYTIINIRGNNNAGSIVKLNQILLNGTSEKITGIKHCNGNDWWVIGMRAEDEAFFAWLLSDTGLIINNPVISYSGQVHNDGLFSKFQNKGYLKPSHNGKLLAEITYGDNKPNYLELHQFNPTTGIVNNGREILGEPEKLTLYACEFSGDNSKLYLPCYDHYIKNNIKGMGIYQLDFSVWDSAVIRNSLVRIYSGGIVNIGSPVLGNDGKIYITTWNTTNQLHILNQPNRKGIACNYSKFDFGSQSALGAPLFPAGLQFPYRLYLEGPDSFCADTTIQFILSDPCPHPTTEWTLLDGGQLMKQNGDTIQVYYSDKGNYRIAASYPTNCGFKSDTLKIEVTTCNCYPSLSWIRIDTTVCEGDRALFQYASTSTQVLLNNNLLTTDTFSFSNLQNDTSIQLVIKYPRSCDSIITINIKVHPSSDSEEQITFCEGDSVFFDNKWIYDTDTLINNYSNSFGCDSTHTLIIQKIKKDSLQFQAQICEGDSILVFGIWRYIPEILRENYISSHGCDSVVTYEVKVNPLSPKQTNQFIICPGDSILINGKYYKDTITILEIFQNQFGCDSIHSIHVQFHPNIPTSNLKYSFCDGDSVQFENLWITRDSQILRTYPSASFCDSLVIHQFIKINKSAPTSERIMLCYEDSALIQNKWYHRDTIIQIIYQNQQACDSIHTIEVVFYLKVQNTIDSISICKGDSILINSNWYYDSGQILQRFSNQFGCDSIKQTQILLRPGPEPVELSFYFCQGDSVRIKNNWYFTETSFIERKSSSISCDSIISYHVLTYADVYVDLGQDMTLNQGEVFMLNPNHSSNVISYKWYPSEGLFCTDCPSQEIKATRDITYFLEVSDQNGCTSLDSISIRVNEIKSDIYVPNVFSPNGDNINDFWMPIISDTQGKEISLSIYDRWGNKVFECLDKTDNTTPCGWNGIFGGKKCLPGVYVYHVYWIDQNGIFKNLVGDITLLK